MNTHDLLSIFGFIGGIIGVCSFLKINAIYRKQLLDAKQKQYKTALKDFQGRLD